MIVSFTAKAHTSVHRALATARESVHKEIEDIIMGSNEKMPDVELIFCPISFRKEELVNWREKIKRNNQENWISLEKWIAFEPFLPPDREARQTYARWIKSSVRDAEKKYPELEPVRRLFERLSE